MKQGAVEARKRSGLATRGALLKASRSAGAERTQASSAARKQAAHTWRCPRRTPATPKKSQSRETGRHGKTPKKTASASTHLQSLEVASSSPSVGSSFFSYGGGPGLNLRPGTARAASRQRLLQVYLLLSFFVAVSFPSSPFQLLPLPHCFSPFLDVCALLQYFFILYFSSCCSSASISFCSSHSTKSCLILLNQLDFLSTPSKISGSASLCTSRNALFRLRLSSSTLASSVEKSCGWLRLVAGWYGFLTSCCGFPFFLATCWHFCLLAI